MLVLTRREGEEVVLSRGGVQLGTMRVYQIRGDRVRVSFDFGGEIEINRREVLNAIDAEGRSARPDPGTRDPAPAFPPAFPAGGVG